jgi:hypothetical protein
MKIELASFSFYFGSCLDFTYNPVALYLYYMLVLVIVMYLCDWLKSA